MGGPQLLLEPRATPGVMAAKLLLPHGSARDPEGQRGAHQLWQHCSPEDAVRTTTSNWLT